jgi:hypothetical protein
MELIGLNPGPNSGVEGFSVLYRSKTLDSAWQSHDFKWVMVRVGLKRGMRLGARLG